MIHPVLGWIHVRIPTQFPFTIQVAVNGHEYLAQQMDREQLAYEAHENAFVYLGDPIRAQELANRFVRENWPTLLRRIAEQVSPLTDLFQDYPYYWVVDQAEYATDLLFMSRDALKDLYARCLNHAVLNFQAKDVLGFLGRKLDPRLKAEVTTDCKKGRQQGARIKHQMKGNWIKMYDKHGIILRVETVINQPREFKVRRKRTRNGELQMQWCPMNKGVVNLHAYQTVCKRSNHRYLEALSSVEDLSSSYRDMKPIVARKSKRSTNPVFRPVGDIGILRGFAREISGRGMTARREVGGVGWNRKRLSLRPGGRCRDALCCGGSWQGLIVTRRRGWRCRFGWLARRRAGIVRVR